jgi:hypothetical protein
VTGFLALGQVGPMVAVGIAMTESGNERVLQNTLQGHFVHNMYIDWFVTLTE